MKRLPSLIALISFLPATWVTAASESEPTHPPTTLLERRAALETLSTDAGPQSPRDIDQRAGNNRQIFSAAPPRQQMNLCNIHLHEGAEHRGGDFTTLIGVGDEAGFGTGFRYDGTLTAEELADAHEDFVLEYGLTLVGGCCGTTPEHIGALVDRMSGLTAHAREPHPVSAVASLYQQVPLVQDSTYLSIGERTNANGSKAFREAMLDQSWERCVEIARDQIRDGAHVLDLCVDYVGRDGVEDMSEMAFRLATASTLPVTTHDVMAG